MPEEMYGLYDRQIRLFGRDTQESLESTHIYIVQGPPTILNRVVRSCGIGGEILKNLVLLGVKTISTNQDVLDSFRKIFVHDIHEINEEIKIEVVDEKNPVEGHSFSIHIDHLPGTMDSPGIYICSRCMWFHDITMNHSCEEYLGEMSLATDCLFGAIVVQEWIKQLQGKPYVNDYRLKL